MFGPGISYWHGFVGGFSPLSLSPLLWLDAGDTTTLFKDSGLTSPVAASGDPVGGWKDKSGGGRNVTQATTTMRPTWQVASGKATVAFDGVADVLQTACPDTWSLGYTLAGVLSMNATPVANGRLISVNENVLCVREGGGNNKLAAVGPLGTQVPSSIAINGAGRLPFYGQFDKANNLLRVRVGSDTEQTIADSTAYGTGLTTISVGHGEGTGAGWGGTAAQVLAWQRPLTPSELSSLWSWLVSQV